MPICVIINIFHVPHFSLHRKAHDCRASVHNVADIPFILEVQKIRLLDLTEFRISLEVVREVLPESFFRSSKYYLIYWHLL